MQVNGLITCKGYNGYLYKLQKLISAVGEGKPIYIVEGEKDVDNLMNLGLAATTNFGGASSNNTSKWLVITTSSFLLKLRMLLLCQMQML